MFKFITDEETTVGSVQFIQKFEITIAAYYMIIMFWEVEETVVKKLFVRVILLTLSIKATSTAEVHFIHWLLLTII